MPQRIHQIITHVQPHLDELVAIYLLQRFGQYQFPGIRQATIEFWRPDTMTTGTKTADEYEAEGILLIGIGGGRFDEHPVPGRERQINLSATDLVARAVRCSRRSDVADLIRYTSDNDVNGRKSSFELGEGVRLMNRAHPDEPMRVLRWTMELLRAYLKQQQKFHVEAKKAFECAETRTIKLGDRELKLAYLETNAEEVKAYALSRFGGYTAIIIVRNTSGRTQIFTARRAELDLSKVVEAVRRSELVHRGIQRDDIDYAAEGVIAEVPEWFYSKISGAMLLNGSHTAPNMPPTALTLDHIVDIVTNNIALQAAASPVGQAALPSGS